MPQVRDKTGKTTRCWADCRCRDCMEAETPRGSVWCAGRGDTAHSTLRPNRTLDRHQKGHPNRAKTVGKKARLGPTEGERDGFFCVCVVVLVSSCCPNMLPPRKGQLEGGGLMAAARCFPFLTGAGGLELAIAARGLCSVPQRLPACPCPTKSKTSEPPSESRWTCHRDCVLVSFLLPCPSAKATTVLFPCEEEKKNSPGWVWDSDSGRNWLRLHPKASKSSSLIVLGPREADGGTRWRNLCKKICGRKRHRHVQARERRHYWLPFVLVGFAGLAQLGIAVRRLKMA